MGGPPKVYICGRLFFKMRQPWGRLKGGYAEASGSGFRVGGCFLEKVLVETLRVYGDSTNSNKSVLQGSTGLMLTNLIW